MKRVAAPNPLFVILALTLFLGIQVLHFSNVLGWNSPLTTFARANVTPLAWLAYVGFTVGLLGQLDGVSYFRRYRHRLVALSLWSVLAWCYFDWLNFWCPHWIFHWGIPPSPPPVNRVLNAKYMNFYFMRDPATGLRAWEYINLPAAFSDRLLGYLVAFGAIAPGMFLTAELLQRIGFHNLRASAVPAETRKSKVLPIAIFIVGLFIAPIPVLIGTPASNLAIWVGTWALLDPLNLFLGRPSIINDWQHLRFGRTLALALAGLLCGFLWEFWNFWSFTKWTYHLPFLGHFEAYRYFEMPVIGLIGFPAFALETWTMWQTSLLVLSPFVEGERRSPSDAHMSTHACI